MADRARLERDLKYHQDAATREVNALLAQHCRDARVWRHMEELFDNHPAVQRFVAWQTTRREDKGVHGKYLEELGHHTMEAVTIKAALRALDDG